MSEEEAGFVEDDRRFFTAVLDGRSEPLGALGGSRKSGAIGIDTAMVAAR